MPKITFNGAELEVPAGINLIQAAKLAGEHVPHFCWHEKLKVSGNCRMCLVDVKPGPPKLSIACNTTVAEGMTVDTRSEKVLQARRAVLEFLLLNHPLDCPVCDKAYECTLQDYTYAYGASHSRWEDAGLHDEKRTYVRKDFGPKMFVEMNRCVQCTRCIRMLRDVAGEYELGRTERGHALEIATYKDQLTSDFQLNAVDVCPVGALGDKKFRFTTRVWDLYRKPSVCAGCSIHCSIDVWTRKGKVKRHTPRLNNAVNSAWMCDTGRHGFDFANSDDRLLQPMVAKADGDLDDATWKAAIARIGGALKPLVEAKAGKSIALLLSPNLTNEELFCGLTFAKQLGAELYGVVPGVNHRPYKPVDSDILPNTLVSDDKTANSNGAKALGLPTAGEGGKDLVTAMVEAIEKGKVKALLCIGEDPLNIDRKPGVPQRIGPAADRIRKALESLVFYAAAATIPGEGNEIAHVLLPLNTHYEKTGSFVNWNRHVQGFRPLLDVEGSQARDAVAMLSGIAAATEIDFPQRSPEEWFAALADAVPAFRGLRFADLGPDGRPLAAS